ncbi:MAG: methyltransferase [Saprospiraceae bacterium]|uniref:Methyltransferase n=1 Tax=Candidatus Opimibacter skivensis TaxID=2982028 RepID=A0A9D7SXS7_9BACT|nr:methyltransferase [Candidatus Opimibacter skivensis]
MKKPEEIFKWNGISIRQHVDVFKIGTDALLLGAWVPKIVENPKRIFDVGSGTGILALMMAYYFEDAAITAIDFDEAAIELADSNFKNSFWSERLIAQHENIFTYSSSTKSKFDLVLCNPPFFYKQLEAKNNVNAKAKHAVVSSQIWMEAFSGRLNTSGHLCIVVPFDTAYDWIVSANECGLYCQDRMDVYSFRTDSVPGRSLLHFHSVLTVPEITRIDIYESYNRYNKVYLDFTKISHNTHWIKKTGQKQ